MPSRKDKDPYVRLAHAIVASGYKEHDGAFLQSDWCETLRYFCDLADHMSFSKEATKIDSSSSQQYRKYNHV